MNRHQILLVILFSIGIVLVISGLKINDIRVPMTSLEIQQYHKEMLESKFCHELNCPTPPFFTKLQYGGIGYALYYVGTASLFSGSIITLRNRLSISRQFVSNWIFFIGSIMVSALLVAMPIRIPQLKSEPFCIDPLCPVGGLYFTTDPAIVDPLLYFGIVIAIVGGIIYLIKNSK